MQLAEGLEFKQIYWMRGTPPRNSALCYAVKDPPCLGWQLAVIIIGEKRSTIFCPYSFESFAVRNNCAELTTTREPSELRIEKLLEILNRNWKQFQSLGFTRDYDTAAFVFKRLGQSVPEQIMKGGEEDLQVKGGKDVGSELLRPVRRISKRGKFLEWFLDGGNIRSIRGTIAELGMTRSNVLSYLFLLRKDHGIGYALVGDVATISIPQGCTNPFDVEGYVLAVAKDGTEKDDGWLD